MRAGRQGTRPAGSGETPVPIAVLVAVLVLFLFLFLFVFLVLSPFLVAVRVRAPTLLAAAAVVHREALRRRALGSLWRVARFLARRAFRQRGNRRRLVGEQGRLARLGLIRRECGLPRRDFARW